MALAPGISTNYVVRNALRRGQVARAKATVALARIARFPLYDMSPEQTSECQHHDPATCEAQFIDHDRYPLMLRNQFCD